MADILLPLKRAINRIRYRSEPVVFPGRGRRYVVKCPVPPDADRETWGDFHFSVALASALSHKGNYSRVDLVSHWYKDIRPLDVNIVIRGLYPFVMDPSVQFDCVNILWNISHPHAVSTSEKNKYDVAFSAGLRSGYELLMQGSDPNRFNMNVHPGTPTLRPLFVGNARKGTRPVVSDCLAAGVPMNIIGRGFNKTYQRYIVAESVPNHELPSWYASAPVVLNDHEEEMQKEGFLNNRVFDALSVGTPVIQPHMADWLSDYLPDGLHQYNSLSELSHLVRNVRGPWIPLKKPSLSLHNRADTIMRRADAVFSSKFMLK